MRSWRTIALVTVLSTALLGVAAPGIAEKKPRRFVATGLIHGPVGFVTEPEWIVTCPTMPVSQGIDGYVVEVPKAFSSPDVIAEVMGSNATGVYDMDLHFFSADCENIHIADSPDPHEVSPVYAGTRYILVEAYTGVETDFELTLTRP